VPEKIKTIVVVPWANPEQRMKFCAAWGVSESDDFMQFQHDKDREGCAVTKNRGIEAACERGADVVVVLDDDCFPTHPRQLMTTLIADHLAALEPQPVKMFETVTEPASRGTPYDEANHSVMMPVAASMGFWTEIGDYCAARKLAHHGTVMKYHQQTIFGRYFPLCGMNLAFRPSDWWPWHQFINVDRFDDIWQGWLWQKRATQLGYCFNLGGPMVRHSRQSNVWKNLQLESIHLEANETLWRDIEQADTDDYDALRSLLPV
jgi:hypothetical protein